jgi:hypothetical protein
MSSSFELVLISFDILLCSHTLKQVHAYNMWLAVFSAVYMVASWAALPFGARGLIAANCLNFLIRIVYSAHFIRAFLRRARVVEAEVGLKALAASRESSDRVDQPVCTDGLGSICIDHDAEVDFRITNDQRRLPEILRTESAQVEQCRRHDA